MKKLFVLLLALCMVASLAACGEQPATNKPGNNNSTPRVGFTFTYNGTKIAINEDAAPIVAALGTPMSYTEDASCAFEGISKTYYYGSFYLETYPMDGKDLVFGFWFVDDSVATEEGIYIGATQTQVTNAYGAEAFNGINAYTITKGEDVLTVILEDGVVSSIQYQLAIG